MFEISVDHAFHIGAQHLRSGMPCQDYAMSGMVPGGAYAIVSDGCSTGARTDIGARVLSLLTADAIAMRLLEHRVTPEGVEMQRVAGMRQASMLLSLTTRDLLATCAYIAVDSDQYTVIHVVGDGVVAVENSVGNLSLRRFDWTNNMPAYPAYGADDNFAAFIVAHGGNLNDWNLNYQHMDFTEGYVARQWTGRYNLESGIKGYTQFIANHYVKSFVTKIAVFSDGVCQVDGMEWHEVVRELLAFKSPAGEFAKRRMHGFLRSAEKCGHGPLDDIAYAVVQINRDKAA